MILGVVVVKKLQREIGMVIRAEKIEPIQVCLDIDIEVDHCALREIGRAYDGEIDVGALVHPKPIVVELIAYFAGAISAEIPNRHSPNRFGDGYVDGDLAIVFIPMVIIFVDGHRLASVAIPDSP